MGPLFTFQLTALALPQAVATVLCLMAAGFVWPLRRESVTASWLLLVLAGAILWSFAGALEFSSASIAGKLLWTQISYIGIVTGPVALFHFSYAHTHEGRNPPRAVTLLLIGLGATILASVFTNSVHHWQWSQILSVHRDGLLFARYERGPMFWGTVAYCYGFMLASSVMLAAHALTLGSIFRQQAWIVILATLAPWLTSIVYVLRIGPRPELDHTPVGFAVTGMLLSWAVVRVRLFELIPVAANTLFLHIPDPVLVTDPVGRLVRANVSALRRFPSLALHIGQPVSAALAPQPALASALLESAGLPGPLTLSLGDTWWTIQSSSLDETGGRQRGRLVLLRDITEQKYAELALLQAKRELEQTLARADTLAREAVAANAAKSHFLAQVSHDLRTPLHAVIGMTEVLRAGPLDRTQRTEVAVIADAGDALLRLINDLLDLSRIEAGRLDLVNVPFQLDDILDQIADLLGPAARRKNLSFLHWIEPGLPGGLRGDADRLRQALFNLVGNAVKFTERGGITLRAFREGALLHIEISDTGLGIAPGHLASLFTPFNRGDPETARRIEGTGLGLAITRRLAEAMGGSVSVRSQPGLGSVFSLVLPIVDDTATTATFARLAEQTSGRPVAIALADPVRRHAALQGLRSLGAAAFVLEPGHVPSPGEALVVEAGPAPLPPGWETSSPLVITLAPPHTKPVATQIALRRRNLAGTLVFTALPAPVPLALPPGPRRRVLLADDNPLSLRVSAAQLAQCHCDVETVGNGHAALNRLAVQPYDLIVLDGQMPDLNGWEVASRLRQWPKDALNARTPIIALTADLTPDSHVRWLHAGAAVVLGKPLRTRELSETLERFPLLCSPS